MKTKSIKSYLLPLVAAGTLLMASCDLEEHPTSFVSPKEYYKTIPQCQASINGCYIALKGIYNTDLMTAVEAVSDILYLYTNDDNARLKISPSNPGAGESIWDNSYNAVMRCNAVIAGIERSPLREELKPELLSEVKIVRAYYYWLLTCFFGDVPFYTKEVADVATQIEIGKLGRMPAKASRDYLIDELKTCTPLMKQIRFSDDPSNHMGAAMGWMLMAKMAQWNERWDDALLALGHLEKIYGDFTQYPLEDVLFRNKNIPESIFEIQRTYTAGGLNVTSSIAAISTPYHSGKGVFDGVEIPEIGPNIQTWTSMRATSYFFESLQTKRGADKRVAINLAWGYNGKPFKTTDRPWMGPKFWCPNMQNLSDHNNNHVFRYADAILMMAECYAAKNQPELAVEYLNKTRLRAGLPEYNYKTPELFLEEIQKERGRELIGEWQRKFDLVRWGVWFSLTRDYTGRAEVKDNIRPCHEYYPIADKQVAYSGGALDNEAYRKYGL